MLSQTIAKIGPFNICFWNLVFLALIYLVAAIMRRFVHRFLKQYLTNANISLEGRRVTWLKLVSQSVYVFALYFAVISFQFNNKDITFEDFLNFKLINLKSFNLSFYHILVIVSIFIGTRMLVNFMKLYIGRKFRSKSGENGSYEYVYTQIAKYIIYVFSILFACQVLSIDLTLILTGSVGLLVGLGLGLQDVFKDLIAGIVLLVEGNLRVGDIVDIVNIMENNNSRMVAKIVKINARTTQIETREGNVLIIPNTRLTQQQVENWSHGSETSRFTITLLVEYGANTELISDLLTQAALAHPKVRKSDPIMVRLANFGENGLEMELVFWADQSWDINNYKSDIRFEIDRLFRMNKIKIPYPQRAVNIKSNTDLAQ